MANIVRTSFPTMLKATNRLPIFLRQTCTSRLFLRVWTNPFQGTTSNRCTTTSRYDDAAESAKKGADVITKGAHEVQEEVVAATENVTRALEDVTGNVVSGNTQGAAGKVKQTATDATEKLKQSATGAWNSVKDTTQKIKDTVVGKAEESADTTKDAVRDGASEIDRTINSEK